MTDQEINEAIAEAIGARFYTEGGRNSWHLVTKDGREFGPATVDLNAMHEAEYALDAKQRKEYTRNLNGGFSIAGMDLTDAFMLATSTAHQRAEAFLRTLNKWKD